MQRDDRTLADGAGGPNQSGCLPGGQSGGMGEGWSDWWAIALMQQVRAQFPPFTQPPLTLHHVQLQ